MKGVSDSYCLMVGRKVVMVVTCVLFVPFQNDSEHFILFAFSGRSILFYQGFGRCYREFLFPCPVT